MLVTQAYAIIDATAHEVFDLLRDNSRVHEYNDNCRCVLDLERLDENTKITWAASPRFATRDRPCFAA